MEALRIATVGIAWQPNHFDHRIRNAAGLAEKHAYIRLNPVLKGLCQREEDCGRGCGSLMSRCRLGKPARSAGSTNEQARLSRALVLKIDSPYFRDARWNL